MNGINLVFWSFVICVFASFSIPFIFLYGYGARKRSRLLKWMGATPAAGIIGAAVLLFGLLLYSVAHPVSDTTDAEKIHRAFVCYFGFEPGSDFIPVHQRVFSVSDFGCIYLEFRASNDTFNKIRGLGFNQVRAAQFLDKTQNQQVPDWWIKANHLSEACFVNDKWKGASELNTAYLCYDSSSGSVYFFEQEFD